MLDLSFSASKSEVSSSQGEIEGVSRGGVLLAVLAVELADVDDVEIVKDASSLVLSSRSLD